MGDNQWLATDRAAAASLAALQARWHLVNSERPSRIPSAPRRRPIRLNRAASTMPPAALDLLAKARVGLKEAAALETPNERYATAHLAALRTAAAVLAARGRPEHENRRERVQSAWEILPKVAPELTEWSVLFAAGAAIRARAEAGMPGAASERDASEIIRDASLFLRLVERMVPQLPAPDLFELSENQDTGSAVRQLSHGFDELFKSLGPPPPGLKQLIPAPDGGGGTER
ncbi:SAV_6107 family HEPN domain-containing protein [Streptomyces anulatus]